MFVSIVRLRLVIADFMGCLAHYHALLLFSTTLSFEMLSLSFPHFKFSLKDAFVKLVKRLTLRTFVEDIQRFLNLLPNNPLYSLFILSIIFYDLNQRLILSRRKLNKNTVTSI